MEMVIGRLDIKLKLSVLQMHSIFSRFKWEITNDYRLA